MNPVDPHDAAEPLADGRYRLVERLGVGGMALVYRAWDQRLRTWRAVKVLGPVAAHHPGLRARFEHEAQAMARLHHRNILTVHDVGIEGDRPYLVMDLALGSVDEQLRRTGPLPPRAACRVVAAVLDALAAAHAEGVVHRDVKPANVLIGRGGEPLLADFGIARLEDAALTMDGASIGTQGFMAPEQRGGAGGVDGRADVYAAAATLFALATGRSPPPPEPDPDALADLPEVLRDPVARAMASDPADRFATAQAFRDALLRVVEQVPEDTVAWPVDLPVARSTDPPPSSGAGPRSTGGARPKPGPGGAGSEDTWHGTAIEVPPSSGASSLASTPSTAPRSRAVVPIGVAALAATGALAAWALWGREPPTPPVRSWREPRQVTQIPREIGLSAARLAADGHTLVYATHEALWRRDLDSDAPPQRIRPLNPEYANRPLHISADGSTLLVSSISAEQRMLIEPVDGGPARELERHGVNAELSPDGRRVAFFNDSGAFAAPVDGGAAVQLLPKYTEQFTQIVGWSPNSDAVAFVTLGGGAVTLQVARLGEPGALQVLRRDAGLWLGNGNAAIAWPEAGRMVGARLLGHGHTEIVEWTPQAADDRTVRLGTLPFDAIQRLDAVGDRVAIHAVRVHRDVWLAPVGADGHLGESSRFSFGESDQHPIGWLDAEQVLVMQRRGDAHDVTTQRLGERTGRVTALDAPSTTMFGGPEGLAWAGPPDTPPHVVPWSGAEPAPLGVPDGFWSMPRLADGRYFSITNEGDHFVGWWIDPATGHRTEALSAPGRAARTSWGLSPDGTELAVAQDDNHFVRFDLTTGASRSLELGVAGAQSVVARTDRPGWWVVAVVAGVGWVVGSVEGDTFTHEIVLGENWAHHLRPSPDGRHLAFGRWDWEGNVWLIEREPAASLD